jgi:hypothetical protein
MAETFYPPLCHVAGQVRHVVDDPQSQAAERLNRSTMRRGCVQRSFHLLAHVCCKAIRLHRPGVVTCSALDGENAGAPDVGPRSIMAALGATKGNTNIVICHRTLRGIRLAKLADPHASRAPSRSQGTWILCGTRQAEQWRFSSVWSVPIRQQRYVTDWAGSWQVGENPGTLVQCVPSRVRSLQRPGDRGQAAEPVKALQRREWRRCAPATGGQADSGTSGTPSHKLR